MPIQKSSGGKERIGRINKMGDKYLRKLLIVGMTSLVRRAKYNPKTVDPRLAGGRYIEIAKGMNTRFDRKRPGTRRTFLLDSGGRRLFRDAQLRKLVADLVEYSRRLRRLRQPTRRRFDPSPTPSASQI
jgi:transposase IS116/IS110/IS902 family protein